MMRKPLEGSSQVRAVAGEREEGPAVMGVQVCRSRVFFCYRFCEDEWMRSFWAYTIKECFIYRPFHKALALEKGPCQGIQTNNFPKKNYGGGLVIFFNICKWKVQQVRLPQSFQMQLLLILIIDIVSGSLVGSTPVEFSNAPS